MGMLSPRQEPENNLLRLSGSLNHRMPRDVRQEMERNLGVDNARKEVVNNRVRNITEAVQIAMLATSHLTSQAEAAARVVPEERDRIDQIADLGNNLIRTALNELSR